MKVLITNGLRQIVSHIAELILDRGDEVDIIDNFEIVVMSIFYMPQT